MIDPIVQGFLEKAIDSPVKLHLLLIFHQYSRTEESATTIANHVCRDIWSVTQALNEMVEDGVLCRSCNPQGDAVYRYTPLLEHQEPIRRLIDSYDDPIERDHLQRYIRDLALYAPYRRSSAWEFEVA